MSWGSRGISDVFENLANTPSFSGTNLFLPEFWLSDGESDVLIQIIDEEPFNCYVHSIDRVSKNGKPYNVTKTCSDDDDCFYCECVRNNLAGVGQKIWRAHLSILDSRIMPYNLNGEGQDPERWTRRIWRASSRRIAPLLKNRKVAASPTKLEGICVLVSRIGKSSDTVYTYDLISRKELASADDLASLIAETGWDPTKQKFAPCPEMDKVIPFNYEEVLKPDTYEEAAAFVGKSSGTKKATRPNDISEEDDDEDSGGDSEGFERSVSRKSANSTTRKAGSSRRLR